MSLTTVLNQMLSLFFIMVVGCAARKVHVLQEEAAAMLTKLVLNISIPAQILSSFLSNQGKVSNRIFLEVFGISLLCYGTYLVMAEIYIRIFRVPRFQRGICRFMMVFGNVGFMGYPVIPAGIYLLLRLLGIHGELVFGTMVILSAMPAATTTTMLAIEYERVSIFGKNMDKDGH